MADWQKLDSRVVYDNQWMTVYEDSVVNPAGRETIYGYAHSKSGSVYIVPVDEENNTYLTLQQRYPTGTTSWECPAGRTDGDEVEAAAKRELLEETGVKAGTITVMGDVEVANGISTFKSVFCLARNLQKVTDELDQEDGIIAAKKVSLDEARDMILGGEIVCSQSIAAILMTREFLEQERR